MMLPPKNNQPRMNKREFLKLSAAAGVTSALGLPASAAADLTDITGDAVPIGVDDLRRA